MTRRELAGAVLEHIRSSGPSSVDDVQHALDLRRLQTTTAIYDLLNRDAIEYDFPNTSPLRYKATAR